MPAIRSLHVCDCRWPSTRPSASREHQSSRSCRLIQERVRRITAVRRSSLLDQAFQTALSASRTASNSAGEGPTISSPSQEWNTRTPPIAASRRQAARCGARFSPIRVCRRGSDRYAGLRAQPGSVGIVRDFRSSGLTGGHQRTWVDCRAITLLATPRAKTRHADRGCHGAPCGTTPTPKHGVGGATPTFSDMAPLRLRSVVNPRELAAVEPPRPPLVP